MDKYLHTKTLITKSRLHSDIVRFFHENQASIDTARGVSAWVRGDYSKVRQVLEELAVHDILITHKAPSITGYSYTREPKIIAHVKKALFA